MRRTHAALVAMTVALATMVASAAPETPAVVGVVTVVRKTPVAGAHAGNVVVWLTPREGQPARATGAQGPHPRLVQRNRQFEPRVLVVTVGTTVEFPNLDPFFHNVFSMFDGRRFDLGLYEAGTSKSVPFTRPGVCYIFCNIHPEMSAVVVAVDTPYFGVSTPDGKVSIAGVPPGRYALSVWHERYKPEPASAYPREVVVGSGVTTVEPLTLVDTGQPVLAHKNKYGRDYVPPATGDYH